MIDFKETDYVDFKNRKCLSYDAVYSALEDMMYEARYTTGLCNVSVRNDGSVHVDTKKYDVYETLKAIVDGMEKGTQEYEKRLALEEEYGDLPFN